MKRKGAAFSKEPHMPRPVIRVCFLRDPQRISIELLEYDAKFAQ